MYSYSFFDRIHNGQHLSTSAAPDVYKIQRCVSVCVCVCVCVCVLSFIHISAPSGPEMIMSVVLFVKKNSYVD